MTFSLTTATKLLPQLRAMLDTANSELAECALILESANGAYEESENELSSFKAQTKTEEEGIVRLREARNRFQKAIEALSKANKNYIDCLNTWIERFAETGVILRDIRTGLMDFPARQGDVEYFLCWQRDEDIIEHWHLANDGFAGRRPLAVLKEYF
jgi:hypothetical protein